MIYDPIYYNFRGRGWGFIGGCLASGVYTHIQCDKLQSLRINPYNCFLDSLILDAHVLHSGLSDQRTMQMHDCFNFVRC